MRRGRAISLLALDVDGVLTDGSVTYSADGTERKTLYLPDIDAVFAARRRGLQVALVTGEDSDWVDFVSRRLQVEHLVRGAKDKLSALKQLCEELALDLDQVCYVGDGVRDAGALAAAGLGLAPRQATLEAREAATRALHSRGGQGAVAEAVQLIMEFGNAAERADATGQPAGWNTGPDDGDAVRGVFQEAVSVLLQAGEDLAPHIAQAARRICDVLQDGGKLLIFGNGGSAADAEHMAAEFVGRFEREREGLAAISLTANTSVLTALGNDYGQEQAFAHQVQALASPSDLLIAISTSGRSANVINAVQRAAGLGLPVIALTGADGGELTSLADISMCVPSSSVARIQEAHAVIIHALCRLVEDRGTAMPDSRDN